MNGNNKDPAASVGVDSATLSAKYKNSVISPYFKNFSLNSENQQRVGDEILAQRAAESYHNEKSTIWKVFFDGAWTFDLMMEITKVEHHSLL